MIIRLPVFLFEIYFQVFGFMTTVVIFKHSVTDFFSQTRIALP
jgi:hypothetical protein